MIYCCQEKMFKKNSKIIGVNLHKEKYINHLHIIDLFNLFYF